MGEKISFPQISLPGGQNNECSLNIPSFKWTPHSTSESKGEENWIGAIFLIIFSSSFPTFTHTEVRVAVWTAGTGPNVMPKNTYLHFNRILFKKGK